MGNLNRRMAFGTSIKCPNQQWNTLSRIEYRPRVSGKGVTTQHIKVLVWRMHEITSRRNG